MFHKFNSYTICRDIVVEKYSVKYKMHAVKLLIELRNIFHKFNLYIVFRDLFNGKNTY